MRSPQKTVVADTLVDNSGAEGFFISHFSFSSPRITAARRQRFLFAPTRLQRPRRARRISGEVAIKLIMTLSTMLHHLLALAIMMLAGSSGGGEPPHEHPHSSSAPCQTGGDPDEVTPLRTRRKSRYRSVDRFCDPSFQHRSKKFSENQSKNVMRSRHGRLSYAGHMEKSVDPQTQQGSTLVENWIKFHTLPDGQPTHDVAGAKIAELSDRSKQASASGTPVDDVVISEEVLKTTNGYPKCLGPTSPDSPASVSSRYSFSRTSQPSPALSQAEYDKQLADMLFWNQHMAKMFPDIRPPSMSGAGGSTTPPSSTSPARDLTIDSP